MIELTAYLVKPDAEYVNPDTCQYAPEDYYVSRTCLEVDRIQYHCELKGHDHPGVKCAIRLDSGDELHVSESYQWIKHVRKFGEPSGQ